MTYASATLTTALPARDVMAALPAPLTTAGLALVDSYSSPAPALWSSITYGNGLYVAVASGTSTAATSPDGITWTPRTLPQLSNWSGVAYGGGLFVAVTSSAVTAATSPDGITWTSRAASYACSAIAYGGGIFAAVGNSSAQAMSSPDGITWTPRTMPSAPQWTSVAYGNGRFAAVSNGLAAAYSLNGQTWVNSLSMPGASGFTSVIYGNNQFVAASAGVTTATSPDGNTWTRRGDLPNGSWALAYNGSVYAAVSGLAAGPYAATSTDAVTWTRRADLPFSSGGTIAVTSGLAGFVAVGNSYLGAGSTDALTWAPRPMCGTSITGFADVYRSPAAGNSLGQDWYLILRRASENSTALQFQVAEAYDPGTHTVSRYGGTGAAVPPVPGTWLNPMPPSPPDLASAFAAAASVTLATTAMTWRVSATPDRVILGVKTTVENGFYAGLYDDLTGGSPFPLVCAQLPASQVSTSAIGFTGFFGGGGFTREPAEARAVVGNFEARVHHGFSQAYGLTPGAYTPMTTAGALYGNPGTLSRVPVGSGRAAAPGGGSYLGDAMRGVLKDCFACAISSAAGDTTTVGAKTYARLAGPAATFGYFVDQGL